MDLNVSRVFSISPEVGGSMFAQNVDIYLQVHMIYHPEYQRLHLWSSVPSLLFLISRIYIFIFIILLTLKTDALISYYCDQVLRMGSSGYRAVSMGVWYLILRKLRVGYVTVTCSAMHKIQSLCSSFRFIYIKLSVIKIWTGTADKVSHPYT
jgi:hypothetical protein